MNKAQHTQGPWEANDTHPARANDSEIVIEQQGGSSPIAICFPINTLGGSDKNRANARLIAAAPETAAERDKLREINKELLEALELALLGIDAAIELAQSCEDNTFIAHALTADKARAAIAKARCK